MREMASLGSGLAGISAARTDAPARARQTNTVGATRAMTGLAVSEVFISRFPSQLKWREPANTGQDSSRKAVLHNSFLKASRRESIVRRENNLLPFTDGVNCIYEMNSDDLTLLRAYARKNSEKAFAALASWHPITITNAMGTNLNEELAAADWSRSSVSAWAEVAWCLAPGRRDERCSRCPESRDEFPVYESPLRVRGWRRIEYCSRWPELWHEFLAYGSKRRVRWLRLDEHCLPHPPQDDRLFRSCAPPLFRSHVHALLGCGWLPGHGPPGVLLQGVPLRALTPYALPCVLRSYASLPFGAIQPLDAPQLDGALSLLCDRAPIPRLQSARRPSCNQRERCCARKIRANVLGRTRTRYSCRPKNGRIPQRRRNYNPNRNRLLPLRPRHASKAPAPREIPLPTAAAPIPFRPSLRARTPRTAPHHSPAPSPTGHP